jgi:hypothetical protein
VEMAGPGGDAVGIDLLRDWAAHAGIRLEPRRRFRRGGRVVVEQEAAWRDETTGAFGEPTIVATVFRVADGLIGRIERHPDLPSALAAAALAPADEVPVP